MLSFFEAAAGVGPAFPRAPKTSILPHRRVGKGAGRCDQSHCAACACPGLFQEQVHDLLGGFFHGEWRGVAMQVDVGVAAFLNEAADSVVLDPGGLAVRIASQFDEAHGAPD